MCSSLCPVYSMNACQLIEESVIKGLTSHYSICPSQLKYQIKKIWLKTSVLYEQLLSSAPYATLCLCSFYTEQSINYIGQKLTSFFKFSKFQSLKLFFRDFTYQKNWFII